jgi:ATP-dependent protease ClpP protease subunit
MIHQGHTSGFEGQATDVEIRAREILSLQKRMEVLAADTGHTPSDEDTSATFMDARAKLRVIDRG